MQCIKINGMQLIQGLKESILPRMLMSIFEKKTELRSTRKHITLKTMKSQLNSKHQKDHNIGYK